MGGMKSKRPQAGRGWGTARKQEALAWGLALAGVLATAGMAWTVGGWERERGEREFRARAERVHQRVEREVQLTMEVLDSVRLLPEIAGTAAGAFEAVTRKGMVYQRRVLGAYGFVQRLPASAVPLLEAEGREITEGDGEGGFRKAEAREEYDPLTWQTPPGGLGVPVDYDFGSREADRDAMGAIEKQGVFALGGEAVGMEGSGTRYVLAPIGGHGGRKPFGFAVGLFQPKAILEKSMEGEPAGMRVELRKAGEDEEAAGGDKGWRVEERLDLGNEEWVFAAAATGGGGGWRRGMGGGAAGTLAGGLAATAALALAVGRTARETRRVERLVAKRTAELADANGKLREAMEERRRLEDEVLTATAREQSRIGRDLHDSLGQKLTGAMYLFAAYRKKAEGGKGVTGEEGGNIAAALKESVGQVRRMAKGLAPVELTAKGLPDALRSLAAEAERVSGMAAEAETELAPEGIGEGLAGQLYLIAQEAVLNAEKHSGGKRIRIALRSEGDGWGVLEVEDDGDGLAAGAAERAAADREGGNGLRIMRHRADVFGGALEVGRGDMGGTRVACRFPEGGGPSGDSAN